MFDLDGTLVDTGNLIVESANESRVNHGFRELKFEELYKLVGLNPTYFFRDLDLDNSAMESIVREFRSNLERKPLNSDSLFSGTIQVLDYLHSLGICLAVATNKPSNAARTVLEKTGIISYFDVISGSDNLPSKPDPAILKYCLNNSEKSEGVMIGDRQEDVLAGKKLGLYTIGITQTSHSKKDFIDISTDLIFSSMLELGNYLKYSE